MQLKFVPLLLMFFIYSCSQDVHRVNGEIVFDSNKTFFSGDYIFFTAKGNVSDYKWVSSIDGDIGAGSNISVKLTAGKHVISLYCDGDLLDQIDITVLEKQYFPGSSIDLTVYSNNSMYLPKGTFSPFLISLSEKQATLTTNLEPQIEETSRGLGRNFSLEKKLYRHDYRKSAVVSFLSSRSINTDIKEFIVADTTGVNIDGIKVEAKLLKSSKIVELWVDINSGLESDLFNDLWFELSNIAIPRTINIWGDWADVDEDKKVKILVTTEINKQNKAVGFFNSIDLYSGNNMDIVYIGDPTYDESQFAYRIKSLTATVAHELTHLIIHSNKVYFPIQNGVEDSEKEEIFLDEGLAHLTESLVGYGVSGGNIAFFAKYLEEPEKYSLRFKNAWGLEDSVGRRGFTSAFLSWLFWYYGGAQWSTVKPGVIIDKGGISFLKKLLYSTNTGWDNLNYATDNNADKLFKIWGEEISVSDNSEDYSGFKVDPITNEYLEISPFLGNITINKKVYNLNGPTRTLISGNVNVLPYSLYFGEEFNVNQDSNYSVNTNEGNGLIYFKCYIKIAPK